jgi:pimeloyl-ACP methyl ester carboxylesterase
MIPEGARLGCAGGVTETVLAYPGHFPQWERPGEFSQALNKQLEALRL